MLPLCSATPTCCSTHSQIITKGGLRYINSWSKTFDCRCDIVDKVALDFSHGVSLQEIPYKRQSVISLYSNFVENTAQYGSIDMSKRWSYDHQTTNHSYGTGELRFVDNPDLPAEDKVSKFIDQIADDNNSLLGSTTSQSVLNDNPTLPTENQVMDFTDQIVDKAIALPDSASVIDNIISEPSPISDSLSGSSSISDVYGDANIAISESVVKGKAALTASFDTVNSSVADSLKGAKEALNNVIDKLTSSIDQYGDVAYSKLSGFSGDLKEASGRVGVIAVDALRQTIVIVEDSLTQGGKYFAYAYGSTKEVLPLEIRDVLNLTEEKTAVILKPVGSALQQAYVALEKFEDGLGIDPNDPVVGFVLFLGASAAI